ncbi:MAG: polyketide synthase dehydratase domain-containing protein, partial [Myxococcales bacterium]|nr:polyketide synthase dehydratase domain-containing protein [Myxococcales bacterium]
RARTLVTEARVEPLGDGRAPPAPALDALRRRCTETLAGDEFYRRFWSTGEHELGPVYRTITAIHRRDGEALAALRPPTVDPAEGLDPTLVAGIALSEVYGQILMPAIPDYAAVLGALEHTFLGHGMDRVRDYAREPHRARWAYARLRRFDGDELVGDVTLLDEHGAVLSVVEGLRARRVPASFLRLRLEAAAAAVPSFDLQALERAPLGERRGLLAAHVGERIAAITGGPADFGGDELLASLGFDSLMLVELHRDLRLSLAVTPPPAASLATISVDALVDQLAAALLELHGRSGGDARGLDARLRRLGDHAPARGAPRLLCLGDPILFERWRPALVGDLDVILAAGVAGPLPQRLHAAATAAALLEPARGLADDGRPFALIGVGDGARSALLLARALLERGVAIDRLYVQGAPPPTAGRPAAYADALSSALVHGALRLRSIAGLIQRGAGESIAARPPAGEAITALLGPLTAELARDWA